MILTTYYLAFDESVVLIWRCLVYGLVFFHVRLIKLAQLCIVAIKMYKYRKIYIFT